ncbi:MAG TPA: transporter [Prevotellaceae bacterium]|nr:transporter [Prevotellaceae bacterium]
MRKELRQAFCVLCMALAMPGSRAQDIYTGPLRLVEEGSTMLRALREQALAQKAANHVGLTPPDPEVEFGYFWPNPVTGGRRKDVDFTQQFDFPTAYVERARLARQQDRACELDYLKQRQQLLLQAKQTCVELVYQNALHHLYSQQVQWARQWAEACRRSLDQGATAKIEYNKALLNLTDMESQARQASVTRQQLQAALATLAGGKEIVLERSDYGGETTLPQDFDTWFAQAATANPDLQYLGAQMEASQRQVRVARAQGLPKLSVGYSGELVPSQNYNGVTVGMSIPLWENKGRVRQARAEANAAKLAAQDARIQYYTQLRGLYEQARQQQQDIRDLEKLLAGNDSEALLRRAYEGGEITLLTFLTENAHSLSVRTRLLEARRDLELTLASLNAFCL